MPPENQIGEVRPLRCCHRSPFEAMEWPVPEYSRNQVDNAGFALIGRPSGGLSAATAYSIINNWRSAHNYPLNTFQATLRAKCAKVDSDHTVAQRIKRLVSIRAKLQRHESMQLSQMQDIGGCRAILSSVDNINSLVHLYENSRFNHKLHNRKDYIINPKADGYRGIHLIYEYEGSALASRYNKLRIEIQIRSYLQHVWATSVETVGLFTQQALKSNLGNPEWLRFFSLMGAAIAGEEKTESVPGTPHNKKILYHEIRHLANKLKVIDVLKTYGSTLQYFTTTKKPRREKYYLLRLDPVESKVEYMTFAAGKAQRANSVYLYWERQAQEKSNNIQVVLVSVDSIAALRRAYPNFFGDTELFMEILNRILE